MQKYVAHAVCLDAPILSRFKNGERDLNKTSLDALDKFLNSKGF